MGCFRPFPTPVYHGVILYIGLIVVSYRGQERQRVNEEMGKFSIRNGIVDLVDAQQALLLHHPPPAVEKTSSCLFVCIDVFSLSQHTGNHWNQLCRSPPYDGPCGLFDRLAHFLWNGAQ
eukprot:gb/GECG01009956.1/.p1 GENE.gb/GECG01009956.1/~~gb/GECG01009956.1/.p1  ORF type:complete len:119 (+),score=5.33 gb/GECG01009956.1/:1-357(+)